MTEIILSRTPSLSILNSEEKLMKPRKRIGNTTWLALVGLSFAAVGWGYVNYQIPDNESSNEVWGKNFKSQYNSWKATSVVTGETKYGGSKQEDNLAKDPRLVVMWAGYPFAKSYNSPRGHFYAVDDVKNTPRRNEKTPGTCYSCKSPDVPRLMKQDGVANFYKNTFAHYEGDVKNSIGCGDCHDNKNMKLKITRPALIEAYERQGKDIKKATKNEMRSLVCAQCHVEYYFKGKDDKYLTFPWDKGMKVENMTDYYAESGFSDWTHAISGAKMLKVQHPDYEVYAQGVHAYRGVSCADCHMPTKTEGKKEFTDHQVRSPLLNIENVCTNCHDWTADELKARVYDIQDKNRELLDTAENSITALHLEIGEAKEKGATDEDLAEARKLVSKAQFEWDYVAASNGMGFHAPQETARVLAKANATAMEGRMALQSVRIKLGLGKVTIPDISSKEKAQAFIKPFVEAQAKAAAAAAPVKPPKK